MNTLIKIKTSTIALYARVSTDRQEREETIQSQLAALRELIAKDGEQSPREFIEEGYTGALLERPQLDLLRQEVRDGKITKLYVYEPSRIARELHLQLLVVKELQRYGVELIFHSQKFSNNPQDQLLFNMLGAIAQFERAQISERTSRGRLFKAKSNIAVGHNPPFGYNSIKKTPTQPAQFVINEDEAKVVRLIYELYLSPNIAGMGQLQRELHRRGIKSPRGKEWWSIGIIWRVLGMGQYAGKFYYRKTVGYEPSETKEGEYRRRKNSRVKLRPRSEWIAIDVPPIITPEIQQAAQERLKQNYLLAPRNTKYEYLLGGIIYCTCGRKRYSYPAHGRTRYCCAADGKRRSANPYFTERCNVGSVKGSVVDGIAWKEFIRALNSPEVITYRVNKDLVDDVGREEKIKKQINELDKGLERIKTAHERLVSAYSSGIIEASDLRAENSNLKLKETSLLEEKQNVLKEAGTQKPKLDPKAIINLFTRYQQKAENAPFEVKQKIIREFLKKAVVGDGKMLLTLRLPSNENLLSHSSKATSCKVDYEVMIETRYPILRRKSEVKVSV